jgi:hypothetical protein
MALMIALLIAAVRPLRFLLVPAGVAYVAAISFEAVRCGSKVGPPAIPIVWAILPTLHLSHAIGFAVGLAKYVLFPSPPLVEGLQPRPPR